MVNIKKRHVKAYILLESLIALGVLVTIVALVLNQINRNHEHLIKRLHEQEVLMVATMAVQTKQSHLTLNGVSVDVVRTKAGLLVTENGKEVIYLEKN
ncbi:MULTISPECIES: competence type IV pilus minor pilin ComGE [Streptococcus]|uniref:Competence type IV pilus minor pilin ComGE n=1 Tax=Streptococcus caledonicus TaxID=2614158 RepID=A0ABW0U9I6_9STRE|nr:competence type IV pilus minor pilin ComGE [Streptococcus sp. S784/96/1]